jgi:hypothetical protein
MTTFNQVFHAAKNTVRIDLDDWMDVSNQPVEKPDPPIAYQFDPLAFTLSAIAKNKHLSEIHTLLLTADVDDFSKEYYDREREPIVDNIDQYQKSSDAIRRFFKNRLLMRRLKNQPISGFMTNLEEVLENPQQLKQSQVAILIKLPDFYREDQETEKLFKQYQSVSGSMRQEFVDETFEYVTKIERNSSKDRALRYYFANQKQELLMISFKQNDRSNNLIDYIIRQNQPVIIRGSCMVRPQSGYDDFLLYNDGDFRFYDPNSKGK